jgi:hypothetical protein
MNNFEQQRVALKELKEILIENDISVDELTDFYDGFEINQNKFDTASMVLENLFLLNEHPEILTTI